jgi:hypothetical protein|nr:hypothetical protein [Kofleriaceae bacterium]
MRIALLVSLLVPTAACVGNIQRSARVPHATVPLSSGQPLDGPVELSAGLANAAEAGPVTATSGSDAVEVPRVQMRDELRIRAGRDVTLSAIYARGFGSTTEVPDRTQAPVGPGDVDGYGMGVTVSWPTSTPGLVIATQLEAVDWSVPYVEYEECTDCVTPGYTTIDHGRTTIAQFGAGLLPSYRRGRMTYFGGVFLQNHPTTPRKSIDVTLDTDDGDVRGGPANLLVHAGVEVAIAKQLSALVSIHQDLGGGPVGYLPGIGVAISGRIGD